MYFLLILSHKKSTHRESQRNKILATNNGKFIFYYFIGDPNIDSDYVVDEINNIVYLKVPDNYESLPLKTFNAIKFISERYPNISGIFKTDDDIDLDISKIYNMVDDNRNIPYFGIAVESDEYNSDYHFGKCESAKLNRTMIRLSNCNYCAGGGYYLTNRSMKDIIGNRSIFYGDIIFEDFCVGLALNKCGVFPHNIDIKKNGSNWGENKKEEPVKIENNITYFNVPNPIVSDTCSCGELRNRREYNFCQKCNKLY